jgi:hypothetical protein
MGASGRARRSCGRSTTQSKIAGTSGEFVNCGLTIEFSAAISHPVEQYPRSPAKKVSSSLASAVLLMKKKAL